MYKIYVIQSLADKRIYIGMSQNPEKRLLDHNNGRVFSTKGHRPWKIIFQEDVGSREKARKKEKYYKSGCGRESIKKFIIQE